MNQQNKQVQSQAVQLTPEELQKTQVLNLQELEETIKFEKKTSKKPAIFIAIIGILSITLGTSVMTVQNLSAKKEEEMNIQKKEIVTQKPEDTIKITKLSCTKADLNQPDGTDIVFSIEYTFEDDKLVSFKKINTITQTPGVEAGLSRVESYKIDYQPFMNPSVGYQITLSPKDTTGIIVTVQVDYSKLDITKLSSMQNAHYSTSLDYPKNTSLKSIQEGDTQKGFICQ